VHIKKKRIILTIYYTFSTSEMGAIKIDLNEILLIIERLGGTRYMRGFAACPCVDEHITSHGIINTFSFLIRTLTEQRGDAELRTHPNTFVNCRVGDPPI
jgi:hypothetical protein